MKEGVKLQDTARVVPDDEEVADEAEGEEPDVDSDTVSGEEE